MQTREIVTGTVTTNCQSTARRNTWIDRCDATSVSANLHHKSRHRRVPRNCATTAAVVVFQRFNVSLAMNIGDLADLINDDDVYNARSDAAAAAAAESHNILHTL